MDIYNCDLQEMKLWNQTVTAPLCFGYFVGPVTGPEQVLAPATRSPSLCLLVSTPFIWFHDQVYICTGQTFDPWFEQK